MKRWIHATELIAPERITIDFYNYDITEDVNASNSSNKRVFKNVNVVIRDITDYLEKKGLKVLKTKVSDNHETEGSDSTYYDVDISVANPNNKTKYLYFRISDHIENPLNAEPRQHYHALQTAIHEGLVKVDKEGKVINKTPKELEAIFKSIEEKDLYKYHSIEVMGKAYDNYSKALKRAKELIDERLKEEGIE